MPRKRGVRIKPKQLKIPEGFTERKCLSCRNPFASEWIGNRMCEVCKKSPRVHGVDDSIPHTTPGLTIR